MRALALALACLMMSTPCVAAGKSFLLVASGIGGEATYSERFGEWSRRMIAAAQSRMHMPRERIVYLAEKTAADVDGRSTREGIENAIESLAARAAPGDTIFVLLIGHGTAQGGRVLFNIPGPDVSAEMLDAWLAPHEALRWVVVDTSPSSGPFAQMLSGANRVIVTATANATERYQTIFANHFIAAYAGEGADTDKDGRVSVLEAFEYARREIERAYASQGVLQTEHAHIEDPEDLARSSYLASDRTLYASGLPADELERLLAEREALERRIDRLKSTKATTSPTTYDDRLEALLVEMALVHRALRRPVTTE